MAPSLGDKNRFGKEIPTVGGVSPLESLRSAVKQNVNVGRAETQKESKTAVAEKTTEIPLSEEPKQEAPKPKVEEAPAERVKTSSLLAKCLPYISDEKGNRYVEEKPNYTLESVEDIIGSAEKRADEKIARMYNLHPSDIQRIGSDKPQNAKKIEKPTEETKPKLRLQHTSVKRPLKIGETSPEGTSVYDTAPIPKVSSTLFDDFSARRTDVEGGANITSPYSDASSAAEGSHTRAIPDLKPETEIPQTYEDIVSHSKPRKDAAKKQPRPVVQNFTEEAPEVRVNEFRGEGDIKRVGTDLKLDLLLSRYRLYGTALLTLIAGMLRLPFISESASPLTLSIISAVLLSLGTIANFGVMLAFGSAFTKQSKIELPLAIASLLMVIYYVFGFVSAVYPWQPVLILLISFLVYDYCAYRKAVAIFGNFRLIASRQPKFAIALLDDASTTSAMARSAIDGEVLAASSREMGDPNDFLKNTAADRAFAGKAGFFTLCSLIAATIISLAVGFAFDDVGSALLSAATVMCLAAAPSLFIADMLPFAAFSEKLHRHRAGVCSKYSAERIEHINAAVLTSAELFPRGTVTLHNMTPLGANNIDETLVLACAVADEIDSPLYPLFAGILDDTCIIPEADSVKYEENLGISGWADEHHIMIGNRSLMQAHGVRVPALDVDRKILHKGYFPIYIACDQRACALLVVSYTADRQLENELGRLTDKNVTVLVENCDPNITEQMLCDYFSLYPESVKILDHNGTHKHRAATEFAEKASAHGFHRGSTMGFLSLLNCAFRLRGLSNLLYILHVLSAVVTWLLFATVSLGGSLDLMSVAVCVLCQLGGGIVTLTAYFIGK